MAKCPRSHSCRWQIWGSTWDCPAPTGTTHCGDLPGACTESIRGPQRRAACLQSVLCCVSGRLSLRDTKHVCMTLDPGGEPPTPPHLRTTLPAPRWAGAGGYSEPGAGSPRLKQMLQEHVPGERRARPGLGPGVTGQGRSAAPLQNSRHIRRLRQRPRGQRPLRHSPEAGATRAHGTRPASASLVPPGAHTTGSRLGSVAQRPPSRCPKDGENDPCPWG